MTRPASLVSDEVWTYEAPNGQLVPRRIRVYRAGPDRVAVVLAETPTDHGMNIAYAAAYIHRQLRARFPAEAVEQIERWTATGPGAEDHFYSAHIRRSGQVTWKPIPLPDMVARFGPYIADGPTA